MSGIFSLDIGGAFIKTAHLPARGKPVRSIIPFELWRNPSALAGTLKRLRPNGEFRCVITMTGELCDCFVDRKVGVAHIVSAAVRAFGDLRILNVKGELVSDRDALRNHRLVASANWVAVPRYLAGKADDFLLVDIGSTTTDLSPVRGGNIANKGFTDFARMKHGELLYTGYLRTTVPAIVQNVNVRGTRLPVAAEYFCRMGDAHLILGDIKAADYNAPTPDGGPKTVSGAFRRLARCVLADEGELGRTELKSIAGEIARAQEKQILSAARQFKLPVVAIGRGAFILHNAFRTGILKRHALMRNAAIGTLDPALALAYLAR